MFKLLSRSTGVAGRSTFVISGGRLGVNNSESQFWQKSFTVNLITPSFLNIFEQNQTEVLNKMHLTFFFTIFQFCPRGRGIPRMCKVTVTLHVDFPAAWGQNRKIGFLEMYKLATDLGI